MGQVLPTRNLIPSAQSAEWIDISVPIYTGMVHWPDDPSIEIETITHVERGDVCTVSALKLGAHTGTHIDAPKHFLAGGSGTHQVPLHSLIGHARVIEIKDPDAIKEAELRQHNLVPSERLLFKTLNSQRCWNSPQFVSQFIAISEDAASYLAEQKIMTVGIDYLSVGNPEVHRILLGAGIVIVEGLNLAEVSPGQYELVCLPLKILGGDGAPARALLKAPASLG
jgi:arylformamidase